MLFLVIAFPHTSVIAQITADETLGGDRSIITPNVNINGAAADQIDDGAIRGSNLFHSFSEFNIQDGQRVYFSNPAGITNILSRVTGNNPSNILGTLGVNGRANLFLINPNGILFGENASLDIRGSFVASTANAIKFGDSREFSAIAPQATPLLTVSVPVGLQFGGNIGNIQVQGNGQGIRTTSKLIDTDFGLRVEPNQTLALVGGNIALEGATLKTAGGRIELGSVASSGLVSLTPIDSGFALGYADIPTFGDIRLSRVAVVDASGAGGGDIQIQGRRVMLQDISQIETSTLRAEAGGTLTVRASDLLELMGRTADGQFSTSLTALVYPGATGIGGNLSIETGQLIVRNGAQIQTTTFGEGDGGNLTVTTGRLIVRDGTQIASGTFGQGDAGSLTVLARESVELIGRTANNLFPGGLFTSSEAGAMGKGGDLTVETGRLIVRDGAEIRTGTASTGDAGNLTVLARESVELMGRLSSGKFPGGLSTFVAENATGKGGDLTVKTGRLIVQDGAAIASGTLGKGNGGNLIVETDQLIVRDGAQISASTFGEGDAGNLKVSARNSIELITTPNNQLPSGLFASVNSAATGHGGDLSVKTGRLTVRDGAAIRTGTFGKGDAGSLIVSAHESVELMGTTADGQFASNLSTSVGEKATGNGGDLTVETGRLIVRDGGQITSGTFGEGDAGNLKVSARSVKLDNQAGITTTATSGSGGNIELQLQDLLLLRRHSQISATAGTAQQNGNGGNITINAPNGFIVAAPNENNDITANAFNGNGGKVNINTAGIFGLKLRSRQELERLLQTTDPTKLDPSQLPTSDITAISQTNPSLNGEVNLNTPDTDPSQGLQELPTDIVDVSGLINQNLCVASQGSEFIVTGRGGLPPSPYEIISADTAWEDWLISPQAQTKPTPTTNNSSHQKQTESPTIIEAQSWVKDANGNVILTAKPVAVTPKGIWLHPQDCQMLRGNS